MNIAELESLSYPTGRFKKPSSFTQDKQDQWIQRVESLPVRIRKEVESLNDLQLDTVYREAGWTIRQVVHHVADSHINSYVRFKLTMTEDLPTIRPYFEDRWAELGDGKKAPIGISLDILDAIHFRWVFFLRTLQAADWTRQYFHPESKEKVDLRTALAMYAWHGDHHLAQITNLKKRMKW